MYLAATGWDSISNIFSSGIDILSSIFNFITGNWLMIGTIGIGLVISIVFAVYSRLHR